MKQKKYKFPENAQYCVNTIDNRSACCCNEIYCACTKVSPKVIKVAYSYCYFLITGHSNIRSIKEYALERALKKSLTLNNFSAHGVSGYYGEEVKVDFVEDTKLKNLRWFIDKLHKLTDAEAIEFVLELEYGFILDSLKNRTWNMGKTNINNIITNKMCHINQDIVEEYINDKDRIFLLCKEENKKFSPIDGNHRLTAAKKLNLKKVNIIYC